MDLVVRRISSFPFVRDVLDDQNWCVPDTMMKFATFENIVELIYKHSIPTPKDQCSKSLQLGVSFTGGYIAGVLCAIVSHPADNLVSFLNNAKGATAGDVSDCTLLLIVVFFTQFLPHFFTRHCFMLLSLAGDQEARLVGSFYPWPSCPHCHDWNPYSSPMDHL